MALDRRQRDDLDRHITGNYGEDQFDEDEFDELVYVCPRCNMAAEDHVEVQEVDQDGNDYAIIRCATGVQTPHDYEGE